MTSEPRPPVQPGPVLCVAPAGSGKTTTVVARLAWRVDRGADPSTVCALTFNRRAADELQDRADAALGELGHAAGSVRVRTFHALGREILADAGLDVSRIVEREQVLAELAGGTLQPAVSRRLDDAFTRLKLDPERAAMADEAWTQQAFAVYQAHLRERGAIDLDDLVALTVPTLSADASLLARWQARAAVLFVDEAQDLDRTQLELALLLAGDRRDIFLVGDDDQTIYAWRLADVRRVLGLACPAARVAARGPGDEPSLRPRGGPSRGAPGGTQPASGSTSTSARRVRTAGSVTLLPDPGDEVARARLLLTTWAARPCRGVARGAGADQS